MAARQRRASAADQLTIDAIAAACSLGQEDGGFGQSDEFSFHRRHCEAEDRTRSNHHVTRSPSQHHDHPSEPVHSSSSTLIYRSQSHDIGLKVLRSLENNLAREKLSHEHDVSLHLPTSCCARRSLGITDFEGSVALKFEWMNGITVKEWLQKVPTGIGPRQNLCLRVRTSMAIAKNLSEFHDAGFSYNSLNSEDIVLSPSEGDYTATFIDLSKSTILGGDMPDSASTNAKEADLRSLGKLLCEVFAGNSEEEGSMADMISDDGYESSRRKRGKHQPLREGLPLYLASLTMSLLDPASGAFYSDAKDVYDDLKTYVNDKSGLLCRVDLDDDTVMSRLRLPHDSFYGRKRQMSLILHLFQTSMEFGGTQVAMISGCSGSGKSTLVNQIKKPLLDSNGCFVEGKFDKEARPDTVLATALDVFFGNILEMSKVSGPIHVPLKWRVLDAIGSSSMENNAFLDMLPNLKSWLSEELGGHYSSDDSRDISIGSGMISSSQQTKYKFSKLIGAVSSRSSPLVLFLDDLQWADETTLDIIRMITTDPEITHFLLLGSYRDNEVNRSHPLSCKLNELQEQGVNVVNVKVGPIEREHVNTLISESLSLPRSLCLPLSSVVHSKCGGVIMFILRFMLSLNESDKLWFNMSSRMWMYDLEKIRMEEIQDDVVIFLTQQMTRLPKDMRMGLMLAACLGRQFTSATLAKATKREVTDAFTQVCLNSGFFQLVETDKYMWQHDQVQQAAYELIPAHKLDSFHLLLGARLYMDANDEDMKDILFLIVDNMNRGARLIEEPRKRIEVAQLNLQAGERALSTSAFESASRYLQAGISFLDEKSWERNYELTLRLYDAASEALFVTGDFSKLSQVIEEPFANARCFKDKLNSYNNMVRALAASGRSNEGIKSCLNILSQLGEAIPHSITSDVYLSEVAQVQQLLHGKSKSDLLSLPMMTDQNKLATMQFLNHAIIMGFQNHPTLNAVLVFRMIKCSIRYGVCNVSPFAFATYGILQVNEPGSDFEGGHLMGRIAIELMNSLGAVEMTPRVFAGVYGLINIWKEPWQACLIKHIEAFENGSLHGDLEYAITNLYSYANGAMFGCGEELNKLTADLKSFTKKAHILNQKMMFNCLVILYQMCLDLIGSEENAFYEYSISMTEKQLLEQSSVKSHLSLCRLIARKRKFFAFYKGDMEAAKEMYELDRTYSALDSGGRLISAIVSCFLDGMIGFYFARRGEDEEKWSAVANKCVETFRKWNDSSSFNFSNKLSLLEAEQHYYLKNDTQAIIKYENAIAMSKKHRFVHEEGLCEEKYGTFLLHRHQNDAANEHFHYAKSCYQKWGANVLVGRVDKVIGILAPLCVRSLPR